MFSLKLMNFLTLIANLKIGSLVLAAEVCCSLDMELAQMETIGKLDCFNQASLGN
jgi:hypothetical protein